MLENDRTAGEKKNEDNSEEKKAKERRSLRDDLLLKKNNRNETLRIKEYKNKDLRQDINDNNNNNIQSYEKDSERTSRKRR